MLATYIVTNSDDSGVGSLREAVGFANGNDEADTILFDVGLSGEEIFLTTGPLEISESLSIDALPLPDPLTINAQGNSRVFEISDDSPEINGTFALAGVAITGGYSDEFGSGISFEGGASLSIRDCIITGNFGGYAGVFLREGTLSVMNSTVSDNDTNGIGSFSLDEIRFENSVASHNGFVGIRALRAVSIVNSQIHSNGIAGMHAGDVTVTNSQIYDNSGEGVVGGDVSVTDSRIMGNSSHGIQVKSGTVTLVNSTVSDNTSDRDGGGIYSVNGEVFLSNSTVENNFAFSSGGGIKATVVTLNRSRVRRNTASNGGGISASSLISNGSTIHENIAEFGGGGLRSSDAELFGSTISGNTSGQGGGGISATNLTLVDSTVSDNYSGLWGGGIYISSSRRTYISNSTITGNSSISGGGGVAATAGSQATFLSSTITANTVYEGIGGGIRVVSNSESLLAVKNTIVASNSAAALDDVSVTNETVLQLEFSLIGDGTGASLNPAPVGSPDEQGNLVGTLAEPIDPRLGPLTDNGGMTFTHALLPGSPALDAGSAIESTDQRGFIRPLNFASAPDTNGGNGADMGAVELNEITHTYLPDVQVLAGTLSDFSMARSVFLNESGETLTVTLEANSGTFGLPRDGSVFGVTSSQSDPRTIVLVGVAPDINRYLDAPWNLSYTPDPGAIGNNAATVSVTVFDGEGSTNAGTVNVDVAELPNLVVSTAEDIIDPLDHSISLREALRIANRNGENDIITFSPNMSGQAIQMEGALPFQIQDETIIDASSLTENVVLDALGRSRVMRIDDPLVYEDDFSVTLVGLTLTRGEAGLGQGGGIWHGSTGRLELIRSGVTSSRASAEGGGIYSLRGEISLHDSVLEGNTSLSEGGGLSSVTPVSLIDSTVKDNTAVVRGGGVIANQITTNGSTISGNISGRGGGIFFQNSLSVVNSKIVRNISDEYGGGIYTQNGTLNFSRGTIDGNISGNTSAFTSGGGGVFSASGDVMILDSTISGNRAMGIRGRGDGGGILAGGTITIVNTTIGGNISNADGGGVALRSVSSLILDNSTVVGNRAIGETFSEGGGLSARALTFGTSVVLRNSIIARNTAAAGADFSHLSRVQVSAEYSLIGTNSRTSFEQAPLGFPDDMGNLIGTRQNPIDPLLAPLWMNGGETLTYSPLNGSPVINAGNPMAVSGQADIPLHDQRGPGFDRVANGRIEMGAVEVQGETITGDFNDDGQYDCNDIDALGTNIVLQTNDSLYDVDGNGTLDTNDIEAWLILAGIANNPSGAPYLPADANLDGVVDVSDFNIWNENKFQSISGWCSADFNSDGQVDVSDFNIWNENKFTGQSFIALQSNFWGSAIGTGHDDPEIQIDAIDRVFRDFG